MDRVDALESDKADKNGLLSVIEINGTVDGVPSVIVGDYIIEP